MIQGTRPRTAAVGLTDSPAGLAAWIVEKFQEWSDCGHDIESSYSKDELLTNVMLYWATGTIGSSFQPYHDVMNAGAVRWIKEKAKDWLGSSTTPAGFALFPKDISSPPRGWAERFFNVQRWTEMRGVGTSPPLRSLNAWPRTFVNSSGHCGVRCETKIDLLPASQRLVRNLLRPFCAFGPVLMSALGH
jgi:hypothetical protein